MDSKPKTEVTRIPQAQMPTIPFDEGKTRRTNRWLIGAVVVLAVAVVALGVALIASSGEEPVRATPASPAPTVGLADAATVAMVDAIAKADSGKAFASFFTKDGVSNEVNIGLVTTGRAAIARHQQEYLDEGIWAERVGPVIQSGNYVAWAANYPGLSLIFVCELAKPTPADPTPNGQISHMWGIAN